MGGAHLRDLRGLPSWQLERTGLVEGPGLLHVLDELEQPRSTCRSTYTMSMPCVVTHSSAHSPPNSLQRAGTKPRPRAAREAAMAHCRAWHTRGSHRFRRAGARYGHCSSMMTNLSNLGLNSVSPGHFSPRRSSTTRRPTLNTLMMRLSRRGLPSAKGQSRSRHARSFSSIIGA